MNKHWYKDAIQFPRLIAEINATQTLDMSSIAESRDLDESDVCELFERAELAWTRIKIDMLTRKGEQT